MRANARNLGVWGVAILLAVSVGLTACSSTVTGTQGKGKPTSGECSGATGSGGECAGSICVTLNDNPQGRRGICTSSCKGAACGAGETCLTVSKFDDSLCFKKCSKASDCFDGFTCSDGICFVDSGGSSGGSGPGATGSAGTTTGSPTPGGSTGSDAGGGSAPPPSGTSGGGGGSSPTPPPPSG